MYSLNTLKKIIEELPKYHHVEILKILKCRHNITLNENNNGTFINLTELAPDIVIELENYVQYVLQQQEQLAEVEKEKELLEKKFFTNNEDCNTECNTDCNTECNTDCNTECTDDN